LAVPVRVLSGLVTDELVGLRHRDLLLGQAEAAYAWGGAELRAMADAGQVRLAPITETHDPSRLAAIRGMVACNTALQVGLDGSVNVESVGGRVVAGPGGHSDFAEGASRAVDGRSIIALRASHGGRSCIVARPEAVTTSRTDVGYVVTEYGIADLRDADLNERARRLVGIAAPEHRPALREALQRS
jgi:acyl-CoA hydrolase